MTTKHIYTGKTIIRHRINTIELLNTVPSDFGIEFDIREGQSGIVVTHDPWCTSILFDNFLKHAHHAFYIVNIKSEGIEYEALRILESYNIKNFFLLDCSFPMIVKLSKLGERRIAIRVSEYEDIQTSLNMKEFVDWVWLDSLKENGFHVCLVSPELQFRNEDVSHLKYIVEAVCTKIPELWF